MTGLPTPPSRIPWRHQQVVSGSGGNPTAARAAVRTASDDGALAAMTATATTSAGRRRTRSALILSALSFLAAITLNGALRLSDAPREVVGRLEGGAGYEGVVICR